MKQSSIPADSGMSCWAVSGATGLPAVDFDASPARGEREETGLVTVSLCRCALVGRKPEPPDVTAASPQLVVPAPHRVATVRRR
jgi:hypothetical protein